MSERNVAEDLHQNAKNSFPAKKPGACRTCNLPKRLHAGVFFDGTNNNKFRDQGQGRHTNVVRLYDVFPQATIEQALHRKFYLRGVGSLDQGERAGQLKQEGSAAANKHLKDSPNPWGWVKAGGAWVGKTGGYVADVGHDLAGKVGGAGGKERLNNAYFWLRDRCKEIDTKGERTVDVFGFSRGAAIARTFINLVNQGLKKEQPLLRVRFLGIFDTVGSFGIPGDDSDPGENLGIDTLDAEQIAHYTAKHEYRQNFPLTRTPASDTEYVGCHSDVGGSYPPVDEDKKVNHVAFIPFLDMYNALRRLETHMLPVTAAMIGGFGPAQVAALKKKALAEAPRDAQMQGQEKSWTPAQRAFYDKYIHQSHANPSDWWIINQAKRLHPNHIDNSGKRRKFDIRRQTLVGLPPDFKWK